MDLQYHPGFIEIIDLKLKNYAGKEESILPYFIEMNIQEDLFLSACYGDIVLLDSVAFYENFPIIGEETLTIQYKDFGSEIITRQFFIFSVANKEYVNEKSATYKLEFASEEVLQNKALRYSKSFVNVLASDIATEAFGRLNSSKPFDIVPTIGLQDYIVPYVHPFDVINAMAARSISSANEKGSYLFYENNKGFVYKSIETLIKQTPTKFYIGDSHVGEISEKLYTFKNYKYYAPINKLNNMMTGSHSVKTKTLDLINRKLGDNSYNHFSGQYSEIERVNSKNPELRTTTESFKFTSDDSVYKLTIKNPDDTSKGTKNDVLSKRYNILSSYRNGPKIHAELPFNAMLTIGDMVDIVIPEINIKKTSEIVENDKYIQGKYIVTALRQYIKPGNAVTIVEFAKDTFTQSIAENQQKQTDNNY